MGQVMGAPPSDRSPRGIHVDWVVVSIAGARRWGLLGFFLLLTAGLLGGAFYLLHEPVNKKAQRTIRQAIALQEEIHQAGVSESLSSEFEQAGRILVEAQADLDRTDYPAALARGEEALHRFELLKGLVTPDFVGSGQIIALQGKVDVQRANQTTWEKAREKQPLYNGDFVKTYGDSSAEIIFSDGTVYRIGSDSLLEVHREAKGGREPSSGEVKVKIGQVNVYTATNSSTVLTDSSKAQVDRDSRVGVDVGEDSSATVAAYAGRAVVSNSSGQSVELSSRQAVRTDARGSLSDRRAVPDPPTLEEPGTNALVNLDVADRVVLKWRPVPGAAGYELQLSRSRLFSPSNLEFPSNRRTSTSAALKVMRPGTYYWRVATLGPEKLRSEWSAPRSFKAFAGPRVENLVDTTPPKLELLRPTQMGNYVLVQGSTEPGATVTVNGESVEVLPDGQFKKTVVLTREGMNTVAIVAIDPAGNKTERRETVFVEGD
jgi:hypothetical protein